MRTRSRLGIGTLLFVGIATYAACKQAEGERCQLDSDCADGLKCTSQGFCSATSEPPGDDAGRPDARSLVDADPTLPDAPAPDAPEAVIDAAPPDAPAPDAPTPDAPAPDAAL